MQGMWIGLYLALAGEEAPENTHNGRNSMYLNTALYLFNIFMYIWKKNVDKIRNMGSTFMCPSATQTLLRRAGSEVSGTS